MAHKPSYVYIMANARRTVLYTGVTSNLQRRVWEHVSHVSPTSFTARYNVTRLVYYEEHQSIVDAIEREKQLKGGPRRQKLRLVASMNPNWDDLCGSL